MRIEYFFIAFILAFFSCETQNKDVENIERAENVNTGKVVVKVPQEQEEISKYNEQKRKQKLTSENINNFKIGKINDTDGFSNLRMDRNSNSEILAKVMENDYFFYLPVKTEDWYEVKDLKGNIGFIHKSRISEVVNQNLFNISFTAYDLNSNNEFRKDSIIEYNDLEKICNDLLEIELNYKSIPVVSKTDNSITFKEGSTKVKFVKKEFNSSVETINYEFWGTDGNTPKFQYEEIVITEKGVSYTIPKDKLKDLFEPTLEEGYIGVFTNVNHQLILKLSNGDGAGGYVVIFIIENMKVKDRIVYLPF